MLSRDKAAAKTSFLPLLFLRFTGFFKKEDSKTDKNGTFYIKTAGFCTKYTKIARLIV